MEHRDIDKNERSNMRPSAAICYELGGTYSLQRSLWSERGTLAY
jgi:hypothetical protein